MTPLQKVAMGLVIVIVDARFEDFDAVPDVLGWVVALVGLRDLRERLDGVGWLLFAAAMSTAVAGAELWPGAMDSLDKSTGWFLSLPQLLFSVLMCQAMTVLAEVDDPATARRFGWLRWVFGALMLAPAVGYGGGVEAVVKGGELVTIAANVYLVYLLFKVSRQPYATAPAEADPD